MGVGVGASPLLSLLLRSLYSLASCFFPLTLDLRASSQVNIVILLEMRNEDWESFLNREGHNQGQGLLSRLDK